MKYAYCTLAVGESYLQSAITFAENLNLKSSSHYSIIVTDKIPDISLNNTSFIKISDNKKLFCNKIFNYNLKFLPIKEAINYNCSYIFFIDADWKLKTENFSEEKIFNLIKYMDDNSYEYGFERPHEIGKGKVVATPDVCFWRHKRDFYNLNHTDMYDSGHVANEQFLIFKNIPKLKKFVETWEELEKKAAAADIWPFAEGVEIGMSQAVSGLVGDNSIQWKQFLLDCFHFVTPGSLHHDRF